jgi:hypothetical protein
MKTLHANLTTVQQSASYTPYVRITFLSRDGATERVYATDDTTNRIMYVSQVESRDHENSQHNAQGQYGTVIKLRDADNTLKALTWEGYRVLIDWGAVTAGGNRFARSGASFIQIARQYSTPQDVYMEFLCMSLWELVELYNLNAVTTKTIPFENTVPIRQILLTLLGGNKADNVFYYDASSTSNTDVTDKAGNTNGFTELGETQLFPTTVAVGDILYIGSAEVFNRISIDMETALAGMTLAREYWNGSSWTAIAETITPVIDTDTEGEFSDGLNNFNSTTLGIFAFRTPSNWATKSENSNTLYWLRFRVTALSGTATPKANCLRLARDRGLALDTSDSLQGDDFEPTFTIDYQNQNAAMAQRLLQYTLLGIRTKPDGFHLSYVDNGQVSADYAYDTADTTHVVYDASATIGSDTTVFPNLITFQNEDPDNVGASPIVGVASLASSITAWGEIPAKIVDHSVTSVPIAELLAGRRILQLQRDAAKGHILAKNNCGQEIWDLVSFVDTRTSTTSTGRVTRLTRVFQEGQYYISIDLGNYISSSLANNEDILQNLLGAVPLVPGFLPPLKALPIVLQVIGQQFRQARDYLETESVGGLTDLGPSPSEEARIQRLRFQTMSYYAGQIAAGLPYQGEPGLDILQSMYDTDAGVAASYGSAGVAPIYTVDPYDMLDFSMPDTGWSGYANYGALHQPVPMGNEIPEGSRRFMSVSGLDAGRVSTFTPYQVQFLQGKVPDVTGQYAASSNWRGPTGNAQYVDLTPPTHVNIGRVGRFVPESPSSTASGFVGVSGSIPYAFARTSQEERNRFILETVVGTGLDPYRGFQPDRWMEEYEKIYGTPETGTE